MLLCKKIFFNKLLIFSFIFLCFSAVFYKAQVFAEAKSPMEVTNKKTTTDIQRQQKIIITRLERIENKIAKQD